MEELVKIIALILTSAIKFFLAPTASIIAGYSFGETLAITIFGGILGFLVFFKFGSFIRDLYAKIFKPNRRLVFSKRNRFLVNIKSKYGIYGLALLSPSVLSIPVGAFIASIYYQKDKRTIPVFVLSIVIWSLLLTTITSYFSN